MGSSEDVRLKWPFRMLVAGSSGSGKSTLMLRLVANAEECMTRSPKLIVVFYSHMQDTYEAIKKSSPCPVRFVKGGPDEDFTSQPGTLLLVDDLQTTHSAVMSEWFTRKSHHSDTSVAYLVQNIFDKSPHHRTISLNATYILLFKNPRDKSQITHLDKQVFPGGGGLLTKAYRLATEDSPHSYLLIDFNQSTGEEFRIRNTLFPSLDFPRAYSYVPGGV